MGNPVVQWQIVAKDPDALTRFYASLFGWKVKTNNALGYREVDTQSPRGINGGVWPSPPEGHNLVQLFVEVDDVDAYIAKATKLGATVIVPKSELPDGDALAIILDPPACRLASTGPGRRYVTRLRRAAYLGVGLIALVMLGAGYLGVFSRIEIEEREVGPYSLVYREMRGTDLQQVGAITTGLELLLERNGVTARPFDVFYPKDAQPNEIGFALTTRVGDETRARLAATDGVRLREVPRQRALVARFPWRSRLSFLVGYLKVDPALRAYRQKAGYKDAPAYALNEGTTIAYMQPVLE